MRTVVIIPARYKSSRFPGKPLVPILGKPMILWVAELSASAVGKENVYIATDDVRIESTVKTAQYNAIMTSEQCLTGTDRLAEVADKVEADIYVNVQGDEPLVKPLDIKRVIHEKITHPQAVINAYTPISSLEDPRNINIPKVIYTENKQLVYISRQVLPGSKKSSIRPLTYFKQVCIYAFNKEELRAFGRYGRKSSLESYEDIEILRFLEWGQPIRLVETSSPSLAVDEPKDVPKVEAALKELCDE